MAEPKMKVKAIEWGKYGAAYCGESKIGSVEKISEEFYARFFDGNYSYHTTEESARNWVERQLEHFISSITE
jgi:hypothetical protein